MVNLFVTCTYRYKHQIMKTCALFLILFGLIFSSLSSSVAQELSKSKCDEYSRKNEAIIEPNEYRKYLDKFVIAKTYFKEYDSVLISEEYALTSVPASNALQFIAIIINNQSVPVDNQKQQNGIYLIKLRYNVELYHKFVCLWHRQELPEDYDFFTVDHGAGIRVPFLRTYFPIANCTLAQPELGEGRDNFCLVYENGRQAETIFENQSASSLIFLKSFNNRTGLNKNVYVMGVLQQNDNIIYGRKLWPNLRWIENIVWGGHKHRIINANKYRKIFNLKLIEILFLGRSNV